MKTLQYLTKGVKMKAEELEDLQIYSKVLNDDFITISVLSSILEAKIRKLQRCIKLFKEHVDELTVGKKAPDKL